MPPPSSISAPASGEICAYENRILDPDLQKYLQQYPFTSGPDHGKNVAGREAIVKNLRRRQPGESTEVTLLDPGQTELQAEEIQRVNDSFRTLQFSDAKQRALMNDFAWEANLMPRAAKNVLVIGCGDGMELIFLRAVLPQAKITAVDYHDGVAPELKRIVEVAFHQGDMNRILATLPPGYDLISSNHTIEHLFTPDETIQSLFRLLAPGGSLISTLPLDGIPGNLHRGYIERICTSKKAHPLDMEYLNVGHPWKTNPADLNRTLRTTGFSEVKIYQRAQHLSRYFAGTRQRFERTKKFGLALNILLFLGPRSLLKLLIPRDVAADKLCRYANAIERRVWFGTTMLNNTFAEEALIHATKPS